MTILICTYKHTHCIDQYLVSHSIPIQSCVVTTSSYSIHSFTVSSIFLLVILSYLKTSISDSSLCMQDSKKCSICENPLTGVRLLIGIQLILQPLNYLNRMKPMAHINMLHLLCLSKYQMPVPKHSSPP